MRVVTEVIQRTYCECGAELHSAEEWSEHKRRHTLEYWHRQPGGTQMLEMLQGCLDMHAPRR